MKIPRLTGSRSQAHMLATLTQQMREGFPKIPEGDGLPSAL
jgi:hypothetical protein